MPEIINIYNDNNDLIGTDSYQEVHKKGLWHHVAHCWVIDKKTKKIIYQRRSLDKKVYPGMLDVSIAGHCQKDELIEDTVIREAKEELGLSLGKDNLTFVGIRKDSAVLNNLINREFQYIFFIQLSIKLKNIRLNKEVREIILIPPMDVISLIKGDKKKEMVSYNNNGLNDVLITGKDFISSVDNYNIKIPVLITRFLKKENYLYI